MKKYSLALILSGAFLLGSIVTISDYGINWDAPAHMLRGQTMLDLLLTGEESVATSVEVSPLLVRSGEFASRYYFAGIERAAVRRVKLPERALSRAEFDGSTGSPQGVRRSFYQQEAYDENYWFEQPAVGTGHLPLVLVLSAFSNRVLYQSFDVLADIASYQFMYVLLSAVGILVVVVFAKEVSKSVLAGVVAGLSLGLFPLFFAEAHFNAKDSIQAAFFAGAIWAFWHWIRDNRWRWGVIFTVFVAFALGVKWNIMFLPFILIPWLFLIRRTPEFRSWFKPRRLAIFGIIASLSVFLFLLVIWPFAREHPEAFLGVFSFYFETGIEADPFSLRSYPVVLLLAQTPEIVLFLVTVATFYLIKRKGEDKLQIGYLLALWLMVPFLRVSLPGTWSYGEARQIMEVVPAMAILAGLGASQIAKSLKRIAENYNLKVKSFEFLIVLLTFALLVLPLIRLHPNENVYFNRFVGGIKGAASKGLVDWGVTYGNIYKQGVDWLNEQAEENANIAHLAGPDFAISPLLLRKDISISPYYFSGFEQRGEYILQLYDPGEVNIFAKQYPERFLNPVHQIEVDGVPLLFIYKNDPKFAKLFLAEEKTISRQVLTPIDDGKNNFWVTDLGKEVKVTRVILSGVEPECIKGRESREEIVFITEDNDKEPFSSNEKKIIGEARLLRQPADSARQSRIEYSFAAIPARVIRVEVKSDESCFKNERVISVSYLD